MRCQHVGRLGIQQGDGEGVPLESLVLGILPVSVRIVVMTLRAPWRVVRFDSLAEEVVERHGGARLVGRERERRGSKYKISELAASRELLTLSRIKNRMLFIPRGPYTTLTFEA